MPKLPGISGREAVRAFEKAGWEAARMEGPAKMAEPFLLR
jgi:predicted RNA binding protein YcfA (HicA-like mRNA interferase family)